MLHFYTAPVIWKHQRLEAGYIGSPICQVQVAEESLWLTACLYIQLVRVLSVCLNIPNCLVHITKSVNP